MSKNIAINKSAAIAVETVTTIAMLTALSIVCSMFLTIRGGTFMKFSPVFIVVALAARRYGVFGAAIVAFMSDVIQYFMFPAFNFSLGICLSGVVSGVIFGLFFYKKINLTRIIIASALSQVLCTVGITTFTMVYIEHWYPTLESIVYWRCLQALIMFVASVIFLYLLFVKIDLAKLTKVVK
ncbi:MAG: folate family ECF transporter S component [Acutalibacteraceae bacterium]